MEARRETAIARELGGACDSVGEAAPAVGVQAQARVVDCAARVGEPLGGSLARENGVRLASVGSLEEVKRASHGCAVHFPARRLSEIDRDEPADERETVASQALPQGFARAQIAGRAELGALVARRRDRRQYLLR